MEKFREWLREKEKGVYLAVKYTQSSAEDIILFINKNNIPSDMTIDDIHSTIIYSKKYANIIINDQGEDLGYAEPLKFHIFETKEGKNALVILVKSEYLEKRHKELMEKYDLVFANANYLGNNWFAPATTYSLNVFATYGGTEYAVNTTAVSFTTNGISAPTSTITPSVYPTAKNQGSYGNCVAMSLSTAMGMSISASSRTPEKRRRQCSICGRSADLKRMRRP